MAGLRTLPNGITTKQISNGVITALVTYINSSTISSIYFFYVSIVDPKLSGKCETFCRQSKALTFDFLEIFITNIQS
jgi:hypothetical protein